MLGFRHVSTYIQVELGVWRFPGSRRIFFPVNAKKLLFQLSTFWLSTFDFRLSTFDFRLFDFRLSTFRLSTFDFRMPQSKNCFRILITKIGPIQKIIGRQKRTKNFENLRPDKKKKFLVPPLSSVFHLLPFKDWFFAPLENCNQWLVL